MIRYAEAEFELGQIENDQPVREHLKHVEQATGETVPELHPDPPPSAVAHLWRWFCELNAARGSSGFGLNPIPYAEIAAWAGLTGWCPSPWEVSIIRRLDTAFLKIAADNKADDDG